MWSLLPLTVILFIVVVSRYYHYIFRTIGKQRNGGGERWLCTVGMVTGGCCTVGMVTGGCYTVGMVIGGC